MSFLNPILLLGALGIVAPIVIHLLAKQRTKRVVWAAMRFLKTTIERNRRRMRVEDWILLLLRCAVLVTLALALARPVLQDSPALLRQGGEVAIILLDHSASMGVSDGAVTRFEKARKAAEACIDALPTGSAVALWLVTDRVHRVIPEPVRDTALVRKAVRDAPLSDRGAEWAGPVRSAVDVLLLQPAGAKRLFVITDAQAVGWRGAEESRVLLERVQREIAAQVVVIDEGERANIAVSGLQLATPLPVAGQPLRFEATITNYGPEEVRGIAVGLRVDEEAVSDEQTIDVLPAAGASRTVTLYATVNSAGFHTVTAQVRADRGRFDDQRVLALRVLDTVQILLVDGEPGNESRESEVFYLRNALTPVPPEARARYFIQTQTIGVSQMEGLSLAGYEIVVLANVVDLSASAVAALESFVQKGGGLLVFPGSRISTAFYNERLSTLLPAKFGPLRGEAFDETKAERPQRFDRMQGKDYSHRVVEPWRDPKNGSLASAQIYRSHTLELPQRADGPAVPSVVVALEDGTPAIVERAAGLGRVVQFAMTADVAWSDLPVRPIFVPLVHRAVGHLLARDEERLNLPAGARFTMPVSAEQAGQPCSIRAPGTTWDTSRVSRVELVNGVPQILYDETETAGRYAVKVGEETIPSLVFATVPERAESDLTELPGTEMKALGAAAPLLRWASDSELRLAMQKSRSGTELWITFLLMALILAVAETILSNRWSQPR